MLKADLKENNSLTGINTEENEVILTTTYGKIKIGAVNESILHVVYTERSDFAADKFNCCETACSVKAKVDDGKDKIIISTQKIRLEINKKDSAFAYYDAEGNLLLREPAGGGKELQEIELYKTVLSDGDMKKIQTPDGEKTVIASAGKVFDKKSYSAKLSLQFADGEALYGLGQGDDGVLDLRGKCRYVHQANKKIAMPFIISTRGYGLLINTYSAMTFHDDAFGSYIRTEADSELDFYFIYGPRFDDTIAGYRTLSGRAVMLPKYAFGFVQSQERYETQQEILAVAREYRERDIPLDMIVLDWQSWEGNLWGQKTFDKKRFPAPQAMTDALHEMGVRFMISVWPSMNEESENYAEMKKNGCLLEGSNIYDPFKEKARKIYWKQASEGLFAYGVDAWWCDSSEPFIQWSGSVRPEPDKLYADYVSDTGKHMSEEVMAAYPYMHAKAIYEGQRAETSEKRVLNLTRASCIGQQKYGTVMWAGDTSASWRTMKNEIADGLNFCASGLPYWTFDIGGFFVKHGQQWFWNGEYNEGSSDPAYCELFVRWFQIGALMPMFRSHGTDFRREIWNFGAEGEMFYDALVAAVKLRYSLLPYIYSLAAMVTREHYTMLRLLAFDFAADSAVYDINDSFMFGSSLLVCPVTEPMYYGAGAAAHDKTRRLYLPRGCGWYDFRTGAYYEGGETITTAAEINVIPMFARTGAIIPLTENIKSSAEAVKVLKIRVYAGENGSFVLYDDEGNNYDYEKGICAAVKLNWNDAERKFTAAAREGSYKGYEGTEFAISLFDKNGQVTAKSITYKGAAQEVKF